MFRELSLQPTYSSDVDNIPRDFYNPVLKQAVSYDRTSCYFSAKAIASYSEGLAFFGQNGAHYRLIISKDISEYDYLQIKSGYALRSEIKNEMIESLQEGLSLAEEMNISNLAYFISIGVIDIKIAFKTTGIFHDKCGIVEDENGNTICFRGSNNETAAAINDNYESFQLMCSWLDQDGFYNSGIEKSKKEFESLWNNTKDDIVVLPADKVIIKEILKHNKGKVIVEEVLLKNNTVVLDYDNQLLLHFNMESMDWFLGKTFYKARLSHKVEKAANNTIVFKSDLSYPDYIKIDELLKNKIPQCGYEYCTTSRFREYVNARNIYIERRAKLGIELKNDATRLDEKYQKFKAVVEQDMVRKLRVKQMQDAFFMFAMTKSANFSVPGSGKTTSALAVFSYLRQNDLVDRIVMIGPKSSFGSWIDEFKKCFEDNLKLNCFNIQDSKYQSKPNKKRMALKYDSGDCNLFLFNYESLASYYDEIKPIVSKRTLLVFDEVHKVKAVEGSRASYALEISQCANYLIALTGTPIPNTYLDIYNLLHILYGAEYKDFFNFDTTMLSNPTSTDIERINDKLQPFFCRTTKKELAVPEANPDIFDAVQVTDEEQRLFEILCQKYRSNKLALIIRLLQLESNPKMLLENLSISDFCNILEISYDVDEIDYVDYSVDVINLVNSISLTSKKKKCIEQIKELVSNGRKVVVWCIFKDSIRSITTLLESCGIKAYYIMGEVELEDREEILKAFNSGRFDVLITNPHTLGESVSLHTICHDAVYFEYSYNLVHLLQSKDRIHRLGLPADQYTQYYFLQDVYTYDGEEYSLDQRIYDRLMEKEQTMLDAIDNHKLEPVYTTDEDLNLIFRNLKI